MAASTVWQEELCPPYLQWKTLRASTVSGVDMRDCVSFSLLTGTSAEWLRVLIVLGPAPFVSAPLAREGAPAGHRPPSYGPES